MKKIISMNEIIFKRTLDEAIDILRSLKEDYELPVDVRKYQIKLALQEFFRYYQQKDIAYHFYEYMIGHFEDIAITAIDYGIPVNMNFILEQLKLFELLDSPMEVNPKDTKKVIKKIRTTLERGPKLYEGKYR